MNTPAVTLLLLTMMGAGMWAAEPMAEPAALPSVPPRSPEEAVRTFDLDPGFRIELVAAEPLIADPVAIAFDENGSLYVVEMRDYSERREEKLGRISRLTDDDRDGRMDRATVFAEGLPWPTGALWYGGGLFVIAAPDLWYFKDGDGDGVAEERQVVLTGFSELASRLNVQQLPNSLRWGPDQRVHLAEGGNGSRIRRPGQPPDSGLILRGRDLSFDPRTFAVRSESGGGQYGMAFDEAGRKFACSNSRHLLQMAYDLNLPGGSGPALPPPAMDIAADGPAAPVFRRSPDESWRVIRTRWRVAGMVPGPIEGGGTPSGYFTGATGLQIGLGDRLPEVDRGAAYIADTGSNLVHRKRLEPDGVLRKGSRPPEDAGRELLASSDNWFRPVQLENGPGGGLYVVDFYREIIEHPWSLPPGIKQHLDLNRGNDRGRIWQMVADDRPARPFVRLGDCTTQELVDLLGHENGWHQETASRLLFERNDPDAGMLLRRAAVSPVVPARLGALRLLAARGEWDAGLVEKGLRDEATPVRLTTLKLLTGKSPWIDWREEPWRAHLKRLAEDRDPEIRFTLALCLDPDDLGEDLAAQIWRQLASGSDGIPLLQTALTRLAAPYAVRFWSELRTSPGPVVPEVIAIDLAAQAVYAVSRQRTLTWLEEAAATALPDDDSAQNHLLYLAAGAARRKEDWPRGSLPERVEQSVAEAARRRLVGENINSSGSPSAWLGDALELISPGREIAVLSPLLASLAPGRAREIVAESLARLNDPSALATLLDSWSSLSPTIRAIVLESALRDPVQLTGLLNRARMEESFRTQLGPSFRKAVREHPHPGIRSQGVKMFGPPVDLAASARVTKMAPALQIPGDAGRGREIYRVRCASCHRAGSEGFQLGPDLLTVAAAGRESLLNRILDPNGEVAPRYEAWSGRGRDGEEWTGLLAAEGPDTITLLAANGVEHRLRRAELATLSNSGRSLMPEQLDDGMSPADMADLLRFIESLAGP